VAGQLLFLKYFFFGEPTTAVAYFRGFNGGEQNDNTNITAESLKSFLNKWYEYFGQ
jgi:hypothetical protein